MNKVIQTILATSLLLSGSLAIYAQEITSTECPKLDALNPTTRHWYEKAFGRLVAEPEYAEKLGNLGVELPIQAADLRLLKTPTDSAVCQKLNELLDERSDSEALVFDRYHGEYRPAMFGLYYQIKDRYIVTWQSYEAGSNVPGDIGPPNMGWNWAIVYDLNLNVIGSVPF